jgi:hypothetical protein
VVMEPTNDLGTAPFGCRPLQVHPRYISPLNCVYASGRCPQSPTGTVW